MANYNFTMEQLQAAKMCKSTEELVAKAKEQGYDITLERAAAFLNPEAAGASELADEELDNVAGGGCSNTHGPKPRNCPQCGSKNISAREYEQSFCQYWSCKCNDCGHKWSED